MSTIDGALPPPRSYLTDLPFAARFVLACFLISVGIGYFSALVQLHFQQATPGEPMPSPDNVIDAYHGKRGMGQLERLITAEETKPFNGSGSMRSAFTFRSAGWERKLRQLAKKRELPPEKRADAENELRKDREVEAQATVDWIHKAEERLKQGKREEIGSDYDNFPASEKVTQALDARKKQFPEEDPEDFFLFNEETKKWNVNVKKLVDDRCARCHAPGKGGAAGHIHLDTWESVLDYVPKEPSSGHGMSLMKLAQSTHVHLLGFSMLYGLTGLIFAFTSYPCLLRVLIAPAPLIAQVVDISFWWLARMEEPCGPIFAQAIMVSGGIVAVTLAIQILLTLLHLFGRFGKILLILAIAAVLAAGVVFVKPELEKYLEREKSGKVVKQ